MSLTKLGSETLEKIALFPNLTAGFRNFKGNIGGAFGSLGTGFKPAWSAGVTSAKQSPSLLKTPLSFFSGFGSTIGKNLTPEQTAALKFGGKSIGTLGGLGFMGYMANSGNKDYNEKMNNIRRWRQYQINPNIPSNDVTENQ